MNIIVQLHIYCLTGLNSIDCTERIPRMVKVLGTNVIVQIACGIEHSIALTNDGELYAWGSNREGQLGLGSNTITEIKPKRISTLAAVPIAFIACGGYHTVVISKSGKFIILASWISFDFMRTQLLCSVMLLLIVFS